MWAESIVIVAAVYCAIGFIFALVFNAKEFSGSPWTFRLLMLPGAAALWPLLAKRWGHHD